MLWESRNCRISVAQWSEHQTRTANVPVRVPAGQSIYMKIPIILWTSSMYEVWVGLGVMSMACGKVFSGPAGVRSNAFGGRNNCLQQSGCGSKLPPQKSWFDYLVECRQQSRFPLRDTWPFPWGQNLSTGSCEPLVKGQWGQTQDMHLCLLEGWECVMC